MPRVIFHLGPTLSIAIKRADIKRPLEVSPARKRSSHQAQSAPFTKDPANVNREVRRMLIIITGTRPIQSPMSPERSAPSRGRTMCVMKKVKQLAERVLRVLDPNDLLLFVFVMAESRNFEEQNV